MADRKSTVKGLGISMPILAMIAVALRFHARRLKKTYIGADDYMNLAGMVRCLLAEGQIDKEIAS